MITVQKIPWNDHAEAGLKLALAGDLHTIKNQVLANICELWRVGDNGYVITRFETDHKKELVLVAGEGFKAAGNGYIESVKAFCNIAANAGAETVRIHTDKKGIGRMIKNIGFSEVETIYKLEL